MNVNVNWQPGMTLDEMEKHTILQAYRFYRSNKTQTAIALGISVRTLDNKLEKYELDGRKEAERDAAEKIRNTEILNRMRGITPGASAPPNARKQVEFQEEGVHSPDAGIRLEPANKAPAQHTMPLPERSEVQAVLSKQASAGSKSGRR